MKYASAVHDVEPAFHEMSIVVDEARRINATVTKSDFENMIESEMGAFVDRVGMYASPLSTTPRWKTDEELYKAFWNERLN